MMNCHQTLLIVADVLLEGLWPISLIVSQTKDGSYPYDPIVMTATAVLLSCCISWIIDFIENDKKIPRCGSTLRFMKCFLAAALYATGIILSIIGFKGVTSGVASMLGFLAIPIYNSMEFCYHKLFVHGAATAGGGAATAGGGGGAVCEDNNGAGTRDGAFIIIAASLIVAFVSTSEERSSWKSIFYVAAGRVCICAKSFLNSRHDGEPLFGEIRMEGENSDSTLFLFCFSSIIFALSQPAAWWAEEKPSFANLVPFHGWEPIVMFPFVVTVFIYISNILVEVQIGGVFQSITGTLGRVIGMFISFFIDEYIVMEKCLAMTIIAIIASQTLRNELLLRYFDNQETVLDNFRAVEIALE